MKTKEEGAMLVYTAAATRNRSCHQEFPLTLPLHRPHFRSHPSFPSQRAFMLQRGALILVTFLRKAVPFLWKVGFSSENSIFVFVFFHPSFSEDSSFFHHSFSSLFPFFIFYWFHLLSHCLFGPLLCPETAARWKRSKTAK